MNPPATLVESAVATTSDNLREEFAVELHDVSFTYQDTSAPALRHIEICLRRGEMIGILGASGAGKSTLAKCLNRLVPAFERGQFSGVVRIHGRALDGMRVSDLSHLVGMVFQDFEAQLFSTNVALEVAFAMQQIGMPREEIAARVEPALEAVGLAGFAKRDPTTLSGGEKQRMAIAAVLALRPAVIVLDEPTTDLDPEGKAEVFTLIRRLRGQGLTLIVIEHEAEELRACDRLLVLRDGQVVAEGAPPSVMTRLELLESCGVHPPDLNRVLAMLGIRAHAASVEEAETLIRGALPLRTACFGAHPSGDGTHSQAADPLISMASELDKQEAVENSAAAAELGWAKTSGVSLSYGDLAGSDVPLAEAQQLSFAYPLGPPVLEAVNFRIAAGEFVAIVGQNGSGKTTLAKHLVGLLTPTGGEVLLEGRNRTSLSPEEIARKVGYVFQNPDHQIFASTVEEEVAFGPRNFGLSDEDIDRRVAEVLRAVNLENVRTRDPFLLSKGERQRLAVASVLVLRPRLLILDEPTTGLDYREQRGMMGLINDLNRLGVAIVIITHAPWLVAEYARRVVLMRRGRILFDGPVDAFFQQDELLRESSFRPPEVTLLARRFGFHALTPEQFVSVIRARLKS